MENQLPLNALDEIYIKIFEQLEMYRIIVNPEIPYIKNAKSYKRKSNSIRVNQF